MLKDDTGKPITESKLVNSVEIEESSVTVKLNLTKDFRKAKALITQHLENALPWATKITVAIAPQEVKT